MESYFAKDGKTYAVVEGRAESGKTLFCVYYDGRFPEYEEHNVTLYAWARRLHGNAPAGTPYGYFRATKTGKRIIITV